MQRVGALAGLERNVASDLFGPGKHGFRPGNKTTGQAATTPGYEWYNALQEELANLVEGLGGGLDPNKRDQIKTLVLSALSLKAPLASPTLTGNPTAPTQSAGDSSTKLASTAFVQQAIGPGQIAFFAQSTAPAGYLKANGSAVSRTIYAELFAAIGTTFGAGDGANTFNLPDLRGEFLRGWDDGRGVDASRVMGSSQLDALQNITGSLSAVTGGSSAISGAFAADGVAVNHITSPTSGTDLGWTFNASRVARTSTETRPRNVALLACIKF